MPIDILGWLWGVDECNGSGTRSNWKAIPYLLGQFDPVPAIFFRLVQCCVSRRKQLLGIRVISAQQRDAQTGSDIDHFVSEENCRACDLLPERLGKCMRTFHRRVRQDDTELLTAITTCDVACTDSGQDEFSNTGDCVRLRY